MRAHGWSSPISRTRRRPGRYAPGSERIAVAVQADVGDEAAVEQLFAEAERAFGTATLLVNSAGLDMSGVLLADMALAQFDRVVRSDLYDPFFTCRRFVRALEAKGMKGRIVNISSIHEHAPRPGGVDYDAAKGGLSQLTATLALELAPKGIAVKRRGAPGMILTPTPTIVRSWRRTSPGAAPAGPRKWQRWSPSCSRPLPTTSPAPRSPLTARCR